MRPGLRKSRSPGAWLALLALYVQLLLPILAAAELRGADAGGPGVPASVICSSGHLSSDATDDRTAGAPGGADGHCQHCCPLCGSFGAAYVAPPEILVAKPAAWSSVVLHAAAAAAVSFPTSLTYEARAPPLNG
ncbi:MAG TPA: DUF2946 family protein [Stellaceae bacterium]|nr:DUF2946 family protein [Stellaceae bacterium]